ncbi:hypothetical protein BH09SUM1_BH09SUM1_20860 [soil metagenome]
MGYQPLNRKTLPQFRERLDRITCDTGRKWGTMTPAPMLAHLTRCLEISLGEIPSEDKSNIFTRTVMKWIFFDSPLPWPKGKIKAPPGFVPDTCDGFDIERVKLEAVLERFVSALENDPNRKIISAFFGPTPLSYHAKVNGRHMEHHLQQFGV